MKIDAGLTQSLGDVPGQVRELEAQGFDGLVTAELASDPFFPLVLAAEHSERVSLMTSIAVAFSRCSQYETVMRGRRAAMPCAGS